MKMERKVIVVGSLKGKFEFVNRVYDTNGISPTINTFEGGNREHKILVERNDELHKDA